jgi:hypothetical protein
MLAVAHLHRGHLEEARSHLKETGPQIELIAYLRSRVRSADFRGDLLLGR